MNEVLASAYQTNKKMQSWQHSCWYHDSSLSYRHLHHRGWWDVRTLLLCDVIVSMLCDMNMLCHSCAMNCTMNCICFECSWCSPLLHTKCPPHEAISVCTYHDFVKYHPTCQPAWPTNHQYTMKDAWHMLRKQLSVGTCLVSSSLVNHGDYVV